MGIGLNEHLGEVEGANLVESTVTHAVPDLAELGGEDIHNLPQGAQLK